MQKNKNVLTEISSQNIEKQQLSVIKKEDRTLDGNLLPAALERVLKSIKEYLKRTGRLNITEIASLTGLARQTARKLVDEILMDWHEEIESQILVQAKWAESVIEDIDRHPETFSKEEIAVIRLKSALLAKVNHLHKLFEKDNSPKINLYLVGEEKQKIDPPEIKSLSEAK